MKTGAGITCPVCGEGQLEVFLRLPAVPILSTVFHEAREQAVTAPRGDLELALCRRCALVWNVAFEPERVEYTPDYENSQHFSPAFRDYTAELADRLAATYDLKGRTVVEIGSGKGEFLAQLCDRAGCSGVGFDPTFDGEVDEGGGRVEVVRRYYDAGTAEGLDAALVMARHVLEHLADPVGFLTTVRKASPAAAAVYFEVPNAEYVFSDAGMWDLIYQHVAYLSAPTLTELLRRAGYAVHDLRTSFHGQFLSVEARPGPSSGAGAEELANDVREVCRRIDTFAHRLEERLDGWRSRLTTERAGEVALWGAGAKGAAFLNLLDRDGVIDHVVDINPRKTGRFVPGTGHVVEHPDQLDVGELERVLILNPAYEHEIRSELQTLGSAAVVETL